MLILSIWFSFSSFFSEVFSLTCGVDSSPGEHLGEGNARIETYPWLGVLYYPYYRKRLTTAVVLITKQMVVATALEIDKLPKEDFRARARVVIGYNCSAGPGVRIRDYSYHPDYTDSTFSAIALIQLEIDHVTMELRPICPPPRALHYQNEHIYAMVLSDDCDLSDITLHKMKFVSLDECKTYYRRAELDIDTIWPTYTACARSVTRGNCVWRSGAILAVKDGTRWGLLGFGVYGPGCQAPARFMDYGMYYEWVQRSIERIGRPAITKLAPNHVVLRRSLSNIQRFGPCDSEEIISELYTELVEIKHKGSPGLKGKYYLNLTIISDVEYSCVVLRADYKDKITNKTPKLRLRRYCAGQTQPNVCYTGVQFIEIQFYVEITFVKNLKYSIQAYGRGVKAIDPFLAHKFANTFSNMVPEMISYENNKEKFKDLVADKEYIWYGKKEMISKVVTSNKSLTTNTSSSVIRL